MLYATQIHIRNLSPWTLVLNRERSIGLEEGGWPGLLSRMAKGESNTYSFEHQWAWQIKIAARYSRQGQPEEGLWLRFYADGVEVFECSFEASGFGQRLIGQLEYRHSRSLSLVLKQGDDQLKD